MYILCELSLYKKWIFCGSVVEAKEEAVGRRFERESRGGRGLSARARRAGPSSGYKKAAKEAPDAIIPPFISPFLHHSYANFTLMADFLAEISP